MTSPAAKTLLAAQTLWQIDRIGAIALGRAPVHALRRQGRAARMVAKG